MNKFTITILLLLTGSLHSYSAIRRVNYNTTFPRTGVDYTSLSAAVTAAVAGDTIQIYGNVGVGQNLSKRVVIQGFGYNFDVHPNLQVNSTNAPSQLHSLNFLPGSEFSVIEGVNLYGQLYISTSNITIRRCFVDELYVAASNISNTNIVQSVVRGTGVWSGPWTSVVFNFYNCILGSLSFSGVTTSSIQIINCVTSNNAGGSTTTWSFGNNPVLIRNSIFFEYNSANTNVVYENNFVGTTQPSPLPAGSNNRWGQSWANLFNRLGGTSDVPGSPPQASFDELYYVLKTGSAAINGGFDSANNPTDCGIFGGEPAYHYKISGMPAIPSTYLLTAPGTSATTNPYNVTISVKSQN